jgi:hypothetical protein
MNALTGTRFPIRIDGWMLPLLAVTGVTRANSRVIVTTDAIDIQMGRWGFRTRVPRSSIKRATTSKDSWLAVGIHTNFMGGWTVNGSPFGMVELQFDPAVSGRTFGIPLRITAVQLSLEDPDGFLARVRSSS